MSWLPKNWTTLRKSPRITLTALHQVRFFLTDPLFDGEVKLANLSAGGLGFLETAPDERGGAGDGGASGYSGGSDDAPHWPSVGNYVRGELMLMERSFPVLARIVYKSAQVAGDNISG